MLAFDEIIDDLKKLKTLYELAQSDKNDLGKQAKTVLVYETLKVEFEMCLRTTNQMLEMHRASGLRLMEIEMGR